MKWTLADTACAAVLGLVSLPACTVVLGGGVGLRPPWLWPAVLAGGVVVGVGLMKLWRWDRLSEFSDD